ALHVEAEAAGLVAAGLRFGHGGEEFANKREHAGVGGRVRPRRAPDGALVDIDDFVEVFEAFDRVVRTRAVASAMQHVGGFFDEDLGDERGLAGARHAGHGDELAEGDLDVDVLEVVLAGAADDELLTVAGAALPGHGDFAAAGQVGAGDALLGGHDGFDVAFGDDA